MGQIQGCHPEDHAKGSDVAIPDMPWRGIQRADESEDGRDEEFGVVVGHFADRTRECGQWKLTVDLFIEIGRIRDRKGGGSPGQSALYNEKGEIALTRYGRADHKRVDRAFEWVGFEGSRLDAIPISLRKG
jgi:hypothetical protein